MFKIFIQSLVVTLWIAGMICLFVLSDNSAFIVAACCWSIPAGFGAGRALAELRSY